MVVPNSRIKFHIWGKSNVNHTDAEACSVGLSLGYKLKNQSLSLSDESCLFGNAVLRLIDSYTRTPLQSDGNKAESRSANPLATTRTPT